MSSKFVCFLLILSSFGFVSAQSNIEVVKINTSAECGTCEKILEDHLNYVKGILYADLDVETKVLVVKYNAKKTSLEKIKEEISHLGYDADEVKANAVKQNSLPKCCQPGGMIQKK